MDYGRIEAPDGLKAVVLEYRGEVRFGPAFFGVWAVGFDWPLPSALIGEEVKWSPDSRTVVVVVFRSTDTSVPPDVELVAVNTSTAAVAVLDRNTESLIHPGAFIGPAEFEYVTSVKGVKCTRRVRIAG